MISSVLSTGDELEVNNAYANIGLIASKVWACDQEDPYRKLNQSLWIKYCKLSETNVNNNERSRTVRDVIPSSRLAQYGDYEYNEEREKMYKSGNESRGFRTDKEETKMSNRRANVDVDSSNEPWMIERVEELFNILTSSRLSKFSMTNECTPGRNGTESIKRIQREVLRDHSMTIPRNVNAVHDNAESQLRSRINDKTVRELWNSRTTFSCQSKKFRNNDEKMNNHRHCGEKRLEGRKYNSQSSCTSRNERGFIVGDENSYSEGNISARKPVFPVLSAEVPEFFPKLTGNNNRRGPITFFPSASERSYQDELFPYNRGQFSTPATISQNTGSVPIAISHPSVNNLIRAPHQWIQRLGPPIQIQVPGICSPIHQPIYSSIQPIYHTAIIHRPINVHEKILTPGSNVVPAPIPVYQRPAELYQETSQRRGKNNQGVDFKNLILLTKNAMKARRNQSKNPQQASSFILESRQPNLKSETDVLQWLDQGYPKRAREFVTVNSLVDELNNFENKCDCSSFEKTVETTRRDGEVREGSTTTEFDNLEYDVVEDSNVPVTKKRLYRDVLANANSTDIVMENVLDKRYDELEQQAMEQYRTSEECLALRYQELERQALEQYKNGSSSSESIRSIRSTTICGRRDSDEGGNGAVAEGTKVTKQGEKCLGFEKCCGGGSSVDNFSSGMLRGPPMERQVVTLRPDKRNPSVSVVRETNSGNSGATRGTTIVTKSLTALNHANFIGITGNKIKGASGDNTEDRGKRSLKSCNTIPSIPRKPAIPLSASSTTVDGCLSNLRKCTLDEGISSGGGDEKFIVANAPRTQVWLANFWG